MKKFLIILLPLFIAFISCDEINRPYEEQENDDDTTIVEAERKVILSDYTAIYCVFCPTANREAARLEEQFGKDNVILIGVHVGELAEPREEGDLDLRSPLGENLDNQFNISGTGLPKGLINRRNGAEIISHGEWSEIVPQELNKTSNFELDMELDYDESSRELSVTVDAKFLDEGTPDDRLSVYITEDSLVTRQKDIDSIVTNYVHNHVLRTSLNGTWGEQLSSTSIERNETITKNYTYSVPQDFRAEKLRVIAFVNDNETFEIKQATAKYIYDKSE